MKVSKLLDAQKSFILKQGDAAVPVVENYRQAGISQVPYFNWKKEISGTAANKMRRLNALEDENAKLNKILTDLTLDRKMRGPMRP